MLYPVFVEVGDETHAHSVIMPDFPGCYSAADRWDDLQKNIQEAIELHFEGEDLVIPQPSLLEELMKDADYQHGGIWMMFDVDLSKINPKAVRLNISLPESLVHRIDEEASSRHMSRSGFLALAADKELGNHRDLP